MKNIVGRIFAGILFCLFFHRPRLQRSSATNVECAAEDKPVFYEQNGRMRKSRSSPILNDPAISGRSVYYEGLLALHSIDRFLATWTMCSNGVKKHQWGLRRRVRPQCRQSVLRPGHLDYFCSTDSSIRNGSGISRASIDSMRLTPKVMTGPGWTRASTAMPVYARLGGFRDTSYTTHARNVPTYPQPPGWEADCTILWNTLWWRDKDFLPFYKELNGAIAYWSRG